MNANYPMVMAAEYNRNARHEDAKQHRLLAEAGVYADREQNRRRVVKIVVSSVKFVVNLIAAS